MRKILELLALQKRLFSDARDHPVITPRGTLPEAAASWSAGPRKTRPQN